MRSAVQLMVLALAWSLSACAVKKAEVLPRYPQNEARKVAVLPFDSSNPYISGALLGDYFTVEILHRLPNLQVVERKDVLRILQEKKHSLTAMVLKGQFAQLAELLGVDAILIGQTQTLETLQSSGGSISVMIKLMDAGSGRILWADRQKVSHAGLGLAAQEVPEVADVLMEKTAKVMVSRMEQVLKPDADAPPTITRFPTLYRERLSSLAFSAR